MMKCPKCGGFLPDGSLMCKKCHIAIEPYLKSLFADSNDESGYVSGNYRFLSDSVIILRPDSPFERLKQLRELHNLDLVTDEEFEEKRRKLVQEI